MSAHPEGASSQAGLAATLAELGFEQAPGALQPDEVAPVGRSLMRVRCSRGAMETRVSITALAPSGHAAEEAIGRAFAEMDRVVPLLNRHAGDSAVSVLNAQGSLRDAPRALTDVLGEAARCHRLSRGAFDVTTAPLVDLLKRTGGPAPPEIRELVDMSALRVDDHGSVRLAKSGMGLTLDGIAKGYVVDRMAAVLNGLGIPHWLIDAGGDIRASGHRGDGTPWLVGVQDPEKRDFFPAVTRLVDGALATSGGYESYHDETRTAHHIVDSATGASPLLTTSATVRAPSAMMADALATAVFVMPAPSALALVDALPRCACLLLDAQGGQLASRRWRSASPSTH
jgi:thiamine biosynthesis lipoprotein